VVVPLRALGLDLGDAHGVRNGGGRASDDTFRSLALGRALLGVELVLVIHRAGATTLRAALKIAGADVPAALDFMPHPVDIAEGVRANVARIRTSPLLPPGLIGHGFIHDVRTGHPAERRDLPKPV
jgi:carbonic anhydrase